MKLSEKSIMNFPNIADIIKRFSSISFPLQQDTNDLAQLDPVERLKSINKVWEVSKNKIGNPNLALDVGSGFGYGIVFLEIQKIKTIGIENISKKIKQGQNLFKLIDINITNTLNLNFLHHLSFYHGDFNSVTNIVKVDLITFFYLSLGIVSKPKTFETILRFLKKDGTVLLSTESNIKDVKIFIENSEIPIFFTYELIEVENNFERTAILLKIK